MKNSQIVPKSKRAKEIHEIYIEDIGEYIYNYKDISTLTVLVWGPSENYDPSKELIRNKRIEMLNALRTEGHNAVFSEEVREDVQALKEIGNFNIEEMIQIKGADMVCLLWGSEGAIGESYDFSTSKINAQKIILFIEKKDGVAYSDSMIENLRVLGGKIEEYDDSDLKACRVVGKAIDWSKKFRNAKYKLTEG